MRGRRRVLLAAVSVVATCGAAASCASGDATSFTTLTDAEPQARVWVDTAFDAAVGEDVVRTSNTPGPQTCTSSADFREIPYEVAVEVPADEVDATTAAVWLGFQANGFAPSGPGGTAPTPPGPGSPSWSLSLGHDGFDVEIVGSRVDPTYVRARIVTPCMKTA